MAHINTDLMFSKRFSLLLLLLSTLFFASSAFAQANGLERSLFGSGGYYRYADEGELTIRVSAYGSVRYPGYYEVPVGTSANELMAYAGGPLLSSERLEQNRRTMFVKLFAPAAQSSDQLIFEVQMDDTIGILPDSLILENGYVLVVDSVVEQGFTLRDYAPIGSLVFSIILVVIQLTR